MYIKNFKKILNFVEREILYWENDLKSLNEIYDTFICGSDQIWNLNCTNDFIPEFFYVL